MDPHSLKELEALLGHHFHDSGLLECALTHPSWALEHERKNEHYQRLEFLGDSVLALVLAELLFEGYPEEREGMMAKARAALAKGSVLAKLARETGIDQFIRFGSSQAQAEDRHRFSVQEDAFEAILGALYLDGGLDAAQRFILSAYGDFHQAVEQALTHDNPKGRLQEWAQTRDPNHPPQYHVIKESGPAHRKLFVIQVSLKGETLGDGIGRSKKEAEENAARATLDLLDDRTLEAV